MSQLSNFIFYFREKDEHIKDLEAKLEEGKNDHGREVLFWKFRSKTAAVVVVMLC